MRKLGWLACAGMLCALQAPATAKQGFGVGLQVGNQAGVTMSTQGWQFGLGLNHLSLSADKLYASDQYHFLYYGLGGIVSEKDNEAFGGRALVGMRGYVDQIEFYGNLAPTLYLIDDTHVELEANAGFRVHF